MDLYSSIGNTFGMSRDLFYTVFEVIVVCIGWYFYKKSKSKEK